MSRRLGTGYQDKDEALPYSINWQPDLDGSTIVSSSWSVTPGGLVVQDSSFTSTVTTARLNAGTPGRTYRAENTISTAAGNTLQGHIVIVVEN